MLPQSYSVTWNFLDDNGKPISTTTEPMSRRGIGRRKPRERVQVLEISEIFPRGRLLSTRSYESIPQEKFLRYLKVACAPSAVADTATIKGDSCFALRARKSLVVLPYLVCLFAVCSAAMIFSLCLSSCCVLSCKFIFSALLHSYNAAYNSSALFFI